MFFFVDGLVMVEFCYDLDVFYFFVFEVWVEYYYVGIYCYIVVFLDLDVYELLLFKVYFCFCFFGEIEDMLFDVVW